MPLCPTPIINCETIYSEFHTDYDGYASGGLTNLPLGVYSSYVYETVYENCTESSTVTYTTLIDEPESPCGEEGPDAVFEATEPTPCPQFGENPRGAFLGNRYTSAVQYTPEMWLADVLPFQAGITFADPNCTVYQNSGCFSQLLINTKFGGFYYTADFALTRLRLKIPDGHLGTYFKITWDILNEPTGFDASPPTATRSYFSEDQTYEWTGSAGGGVDRYSDWYEIPTPDFNGQRRVVNVRYECYRLTNYGNKPQVTGEQVDLSVEVETTRMGASGKIAASGKGGKTSSNSLRVTGLTVTGLKITGLKITGLETSGRAGGGLRGGGLEVNGLESGGGLKTSGLRVSGLSTNRIQSSSQYGLQTSGLRVTRLQSSSGLQRSGGLRSSGGLRTGKL
jgi:hypothetical protein